MKDDEKEKRKLLLKNTFRLRALELCNPIQGPLATCGYLNEIHPWCMSHISCGYHAGQSRTFSVGSPALEFFKS
jgi:hypothetical protein